MKKQIENLYLLRQNILKVIEGLNTVQLNEIPKGFNNNIIWNLAHLIAAQQGVCYRRANLPMVVPEMYLTDFMPGTKPEKLYGEDFIQQTKVHLLSTIDLFAEDLEKQIFINYQPWTTRYGIEITNIDDMLKFLAFHEGLHTGYIMALKRVINKSY